MDNFNQFIKEKVEQFDVSYNDAHWTELEGKLNKIRSAKIRRNTFSAIGSIAIISISSFLYFNHTTDNNSTLLVDTTNSTTIDHTLTIEQKENTFTNNSKNNISLTSSTTILPTDNEEGQTLTEETVPQNQEERNIPLEKNFERDYTTPPSSNPLKLDAAFIVFNNQICVGEEVSFEANERNMAISYFWDFGDGTTSKKQNPNHVYVESGRYDVTLVLIERKSRIKVQHTERNAAVIFPKPKAEFSYTETSLKHDNNKLKYPYTQFNSKDIANTNTYSWNFGNGETSTTQNPAILFKKKGVFQTMLTVKNSYGCYNSSAKNVKIKNAFELYAPNAFTPNGDGENDNFIPKALLGWDVQFEMTITNKSNQVIYKSSDKNEPWEGKLNNNGSVLPHGIYLWKVITYDAEGKKHLHVGKVNLLH